MKKFNYLYLLFIPLLLIAAINSSNIDEESFTEKIIYSDSSFADANSNYQKSCAGCHGADLEEFFGRDWIFGNSHDDIFEIIKHGDEDMGMPGFAKLYSDKEINELTEFILTEIQKESNRERKFVLVPDIIESEKQKFKIDTLVQGIKIPWGMAFLPDGDILITERSGNLYRFSNGKLSEPINSVPEVLDKGQGGLLDIIIHPEYEKNGWIYLSYSAPAENGRGSNTAIMRAKLTDQKLIDKKIIYKAETDPTTNHHYGSRMGFDKEGFLYFSVGDRGTMEDAQSLSNHMGKIHRIHDDGKIPDDNPFVDYENAVASIFSYGHRNPQGLVFHPETDELWIHEHGPKGGDEINIVEKGKNYGWPEISFGINYDGTILTPDTAKAGMEQPLYYWIPSIGPSGIAFSTSGKYSGWIDNLFAGSLSFKYLERLEISGNEVVHREKLLEDIGRVRNVLQGPDGLLYVSVENPGVILKLIPVED
jgi:aldose sugar dehydrogenase